MYKTKLFNPFGKYGSLFINAAIASFVCVVAISCSSSHINDGAKTDANGNSIRYVTLKMVYDIKAENHLDRFQLKELMPRTINNVQVIKSAKYSIEPDSVGFDGLNQYAYFHVNGLEKELKIEVDLEMALYEQSETQQDSSKLSKNELAKYLVSERYIESNSPEIKAVADTLKQSSDVETIVKTYFFVHNLLKYQADKSPDTVGAKRALERGYGDCSEFSDLFVALVRANGIPAKSVDGLYVDHVVDNPWHAWSEVYLPKNGWVTFDPTGRHNMVNDGEGFVRVSHRNSYIVFREQRKHPENGKGVQCSYHYFPARGNRVTVKNDYIMKTH